MINEWDLGCKRSSIVQLISFWWLIVGIYILTTIIAIDVHTI